MDQSCALMAKHQQTEDCVQIIRILFFKKAKKNYQKNNYSEIRVTEPLHIEQNILFCFSILKIYQRSLNR